MKNKKKIISEKSAWRQFELMVARLQKALSPIGAVVKSPDHLMDNVSHVLREVDATIRFKNNGKEVLVGVECRDRNRNPDQTWIEQMVTKHRHLGITKSVAVTAKNFSNPIMEKAKYYGIELRKVQRIDEQAIFKMITLKGEMALYHGVDYNFTLDVPDKYRDIVISEFKKVNQNIFDAKVFRSRITGNYFNLRNCFEDFLNRAKEKMPEIEIPDDGSHTGEYKINAQIAKGQGFFNTSAGEFDLIGLHVTCTFYKKSIGSYTIEPENAFKYGNTERTMVEAREFTITKDGGEKELLSIHVDLSSKRVISGKWKRLDDGSIEKGD